jgi:hypothetical protein
MDGVLSPGSPAHRIETSGLNLRGQTLFNPNLTDPGARRVLIHNTFPLMEHSQLVISLVVSSVLELSTLNKKSEPPQRGRRVLRFGDLNLL